ncbi:hypothetical protein AHAS_Ahas19G0109800 [Arachis hypogaea]
MYYYSNGLFQVEEDPITNETFVAETESVPIGTSQSTIKEMSSFLMEKMDPRPVTQCGCNALIKVHVDLRNRRWYMEFFSDEHNHDMLEARRNKYKCPLVVFSGVDHHMRTVVFGCAVLSKEGEESYMWLFRAFLEAMKGKAPKGKFFAGLKITSRCEALNMQIGKFIYNGYKFREFIEHFQQYLEFMRRRVVVADYKSAYGDPVVKTRLEELERFVAIVYTRVGVLVRLNIVVIPDSLILGHWTKKAKQPPINNHVFSGEIPDAAYMSMHTAMLDDYRELVKLSCSYFDDYFEVKTKIANEQEALREKIQKRLATTAEGGGDDASIHGPPRARHKGCGRHVVTTRGRYRRVQRCRKCDKAGHNARRCVDRMVTTPQMNYMPWDHRTTWTNHKKLRLRNRWNTMV